MLFAWVIADTYFGLLLIETYEKRFLPLASENEPSGRTGMTLTHFNAPQYVGVSAWIRAIHFGSCHTGRA